MDKVRLGIYIIIVDIVSTVNAALFIRNKIKNEVLSILKKMTF